MDGVVGGGDKGGQKNETHCPEWEQPGDNGGLHQHASIVSGWGGGPGRGGKRSSFTLLGRPRPATVSTHVPSGLVD